MAFLGDQQMAFLGDQLSCGFLWHATLHPWWLLPSGAFVTCHYPSNHCFNQVYLSLGTVSFEWSFWHCLLDAWCRIERALKLTSLVLDASVSTCLPLLWMEQRQARDFRTFSIFVYLWSKLQTYWSFLSALDLIYFVLSQLGSVWFGWIGVSLLQLNLSP